MESVPGTPYAVALVEVAPTTSGPAVASTVAGVGSILVSLVVGCFGLVGANSGWGPTVAGAFAVLAGLAGIAAIVLGQLGLRQIRRAGGPRSVHGKGAAITGLACGAVGLGLTVIGVLLSLALTAAATNG